MLRLRSLTGALMAGVLLSGCGEPKFENVGSRNSLVEDQQACAVEVAKSPAAALEYRQNPAAHPDFQGQAFANMIHCIEPKSGSRSEPNASPSRLATPMPQAGWIRHLVRLRKGINHGPYSNFGNLLSANHCGDGAGDHVGHEHRGAAS